MRKVAVWGFVVVAVALLFTGTQAQRITLAPTAVTRTPSQVEVVNFPAVQGVAGDVQVTNLPLDNMGRVVVALPTIQVGNAALVLRSTTATYQGDLGGRTGATQK